MIKEKEVYNQVCGASGCNVAACTRVVFSVGFSAYFCDRCASKLVKNGVGEMERNPEGCADMHPEQADNRIFTR